MLITAVWPVAYLNINTAYVQIPALRNTLAEKHVTKILKCLIISAAPCIHIDLQIYSFITWQSYVKHNTEAR